MNENYLSLIVNQYLNASGLKNADLKSESFISELIKWMEERKSIAKLYKSLLQLMELGYYEYPNAAEVGKGEFDSISLDNDSNIITPYTRGIPSNKLIKGDLRVFGGTPVLLGNQKELTYVNISTFFTQNPYSNDLIKHYEKLPMFGDNVIVGVYGNLNDKDCYEKLNMLKNFAESFETPYNSEYVTSGDAYLSIVANKKEKRKIKAKTFNN